MFQKLRCYHCDVQGSTYMKLGDFSRFYCLRCEGHWDAADVAEQITDRRESDQTCDLDEIQEQTAEWQNVLDFANEGTNKAPAKTVRANRLDEINREIEVFTPAALEFLKTSLELTAKAKGLTGAQMQLAELATLYCERIAERAKLEG